MSSRNLDETNIKQWHLEMYMLHMNDFCYGASYDIYDYSVIRSALDVKFLDFTPYAWLLENEVAWMPNRINPKILRKESWAGINYTDFGKISLNSNISYTLNNSSSLKYNYPRAKTQGNLYIWPESNLNLLSPIWRFEKVKPKFIDTLENLSNIGGEFPRDKFPKGIMGLTNGILDYMEKQGKVFWALGEK